MNNNNKTNYRIVSMKIKIVFLFLMTKILRHLLIEEVILKKYILYNFVDYRVFIIKIMWRNIKMEIKIYNIFNRIFS